MPPRASSGGSALRRGRCPRDRLRGTAEKQAGGCGAALPLGTLYRPRPLTDTPPPPRASWGSPQPPWAPHGLPRPKTPHHCRGRSCELPTSDPAGARVCAMGTESPMAVQGSAILSHGFYNLPASSAAQGRWDTQADGFVPRKAQLRRSDATHKRSKCPDLGSINFSLLRLNRKKYPMKGLNSLRMHNGIS